MSRRSVIVYGGRTYTVVDQDPDTLRDHITTRLTEDAVLWLTVNATEGRFTRAQLLITATTEIAILDDRNAEHTTQFEPITPSAEDIND